VARKLERDLGLSSVVAISVGAMVGSGIFILPALALELAGPAVIVAYVLAGFIVLPAALSKSEMATAMPEAGGTYIYIERSMGPILGTIAGVGTWFSLTFKGGLALVGGAPYLVLLFDLPVTPVAVGLTIALTVVNMLGAKQTGRTQIVLVSIMLAALAWFVFGSWPALEPRGFDGFYDEGTAGLLAATGFVFVSYGGVTKIASIAEEIERPERNIPLGMLGSLALTTMLYVLIVIVLVGVSYGLDLAGSHTPLADVAEMTLAQPGVIAIIAAAILALVSTANAGLMSSSRYPFAMSRDHLAPPQFAHVSERFGTPIVAIATTGAATVLLVVTVPIMEIAKLASAFKILVFIMINVALIVFRETDTDHYDPAFRDPLYPFSQAFGIIGGSVLLTQMGWVPALGAVAIVAFGMLWYALFGRPERRAADRETIRPTSDPGAADQHRVSLEGSDVFDVLVVVDEGMDQTRESILVQLASHAAEVQEGEMTVVQFDDVPDQLSLEQATTLQSPSDDAFEARMEASAARTEVPVEFGEIVTHDRRHSIVNLATHHDADLIVIGSESPDWSERFLGTTTHWVVDHTPCDLLLVDTESLSGEGPVAFVTDEEPALSLYLQLADALATSRGSELIVVQGMAPEQRDERDERLEAYRRELEATCTSNVTFRPIESRDPADWIAEVSEVDWALVQLRPRGGFSEQRQKELYDALEGSIALVQSPPDEPPGFVARLLGRLTS
jgi:amino acid transporter